MYWKITQDYLYDGNYITENRTGKEVGERNESEPLLRVRLYDDDEELYYTVLSEDSSLEDLYEWAMYDSGVTILKVWERGKGWVHTI